MVLVNYWLGSVFFMFFFLMFLEFFYLIDS